VQGLGPARATLGRTPHPKPGAVWRAATLLCVPAATLLAPPAQATSFGRYCDTQDKLSAEQKDKLFGFSAVIKSELERSGASAVLMARSGLDLARFSIRYSHAGVSLKNSPESPWAVRQLYYACDEQTPRIFDQGLSAFLMGTDQPSLGYISVVLLPSAEEAQLAASALNNATALGLLSTSYRANAYAFSLNHQNCNQWLAELLATAWGSPTTASRASAQHWLSIESYAPSTVEVGSRLLMWAGITFVPYLTHEDHPPEDLQATRYRVSMPAAIESFVRQRLPAARRIEFCHDGTRVVIKRGWGAIAEGCVPGEGDEMVALP
jgi:hypothetical protein